MSGTGCSARAILTRRLAHTAAGTGHREHFETFCAGQLERIERITDRQVQRVREVRRRRDARAVDKAGCELEVRVRGSVGSDAHANSDTPEALV